MTHRKQNGKANGSANGAASPIANSVARSEYRKNPARYVEQARTSGPVTITDEAGRPRIMIVAPKRVVGYDGS